MHPTLALIPSSDLISLPKAEVHIHLEGCIEVDDIVRLAAEAGEPLPRPREQLLDFSSGLGGFLAFLDWFCGLVRTPEQLFDLAYAFSRRMAGSGARYADVMISPVHWTAWSNDPPALIEASSEAVSWCMCRSMPTDRCGATSACTSARAGPFPRWPMCSCTHSSKA